MNINKLSYLLSGFIWFGGVSFAQTTTITTGQTVADTAPSITGHNINFDGTLTLSSDSTYDTGAALLSVSNDFTRSAGTGTNQVQWQGSGGFINTSSPALYNVNLGGLSTPSTLTWGQGGFVPNGSALVLGGVWFRNGINFGTDTSATHQVDLSGNTLASGQLSGSGNLLLQAYGSSSTSHEPSLTLVSINGGTPGAINVSGALTLNHIFLAGVVTASAIHETNGSIALVAPTGALDLSLSGSSVFNVSSLLVSGSSSSPISQTLKTLNSTDVNSIVVIGGEMPTSGGKVNVESGVLTVGSGYYQGAIDDTNNTAGNTNASAGGSLIKNTSGILTLAGNSGSTTFGSTYTQGTTVQQGTLLVANTAGSATGSGGVTVMTGASLGGTGIIAPTGTHNFLVQSGGKIDLSAYDPAHVPPSFTNKLTIQLVSTNSATFASGSSFVFDLGAEETSSELAFTGLKLNTPEVFFNNNQVSLDFLAGAGNGEYTLFTFDQADAYSGTLQNVPGYSFIYTADSILVDVPEPPSALLFLSGMAILCWIGFCGVRKQLLS